jgi:hypothetical protein
VVNEVGLDGEVIMLKDTTYAVLLPENKKALESVEPKQVRVLRSTVLRLDFHIRERFA